MKSRIANHTQSVSCGYLQTFKRIVSLFFFKEDSDAYVLYTIRPVVVLCYVSNYKGTWKNMKSLA